VSLGQVVRPDAVLASNTSSIPIAELAAAVDRPERVLGLHFFSPVPVMELVEVVVALDTSEATLQRARASRRRSASSRSRPKTRGFYEYAPHPELAYA
jgi:3-hydroxybutyryl-CoA dehydrogenase